MAEQIMVKWDISQAIVDKDEFEIIKMMVEDAGAKESLGNLKKVIGELIGQGYEESRARNLCLLARGSLRYPDSVTISPYPPASSTASP